jgi:cyclopropane fatty-acyl-phospholipid synthase-like methyltransferase
VPYLRHHFGRDLPANQAARILDLGCGFGRLLFFLKRSGYTNVVGIDASAPQVELAHTLGMHEVLKATADNFLADHKSEFDVIFAVDLLEHLTRDELFPLLDGIAAALIPGGRLVVQTVNAQSPFFGYTRYGDLTHEIGFTKLSIHQALEAAGLNHVAVRPLEPAPVGLNGTLRWITWKVVTGLLTVCCAAEIGTVRGHVLTQNLIAVCQKRTS